MQIATCKFARCNLHFATNTPNFLIASGLAAGRMRTDGVSDIPTNEPSPTYPMRSGHGYAAAPRVHLDRVAGRHRHHCRADRPVVAGRAESARGRLSHGLHE